MKKYKWVTLFFTLLLFGPVGSYAQEANAESGFSDSQTINPNQNAEWRSGQGKFSARPRDMWELGINAGLFQITGDIPPSLPGGFAVGLSLRKALNYAISIRGDFTYGQTRGVDYRLISNSTGQREYPDIAALYGNTQMPRRYQTRYYAADLQGIVNIGNILFHKQQNKWNLYLILGMGLYTHDTRLDFLDSNGNPYNLSSIPSATESAADRRDVRSQIKDLMDGEFETRGSLKNSGLRLNEYMNILGQLNAGFGVSRKLNRRVNLGLEYTARFSDNDHLDGFIYRSAQDLTNNRDIVHLLTMRLGINLGSFDDKIEPLYWVNPLDAVFDDIAELKRRPVFDLTDSDGDGVIDLLDLEPNTPPGAIVDVKGRTLDSDGDGIPDYLDKEPFSPPGYEVDEDGVANRPDYMTEEGVTELVNSKISNIKMEWYLPTIHFDLDKYFIKPEFYSALHQIAQVMKTHPNLNVVATGHADNRGASDYNNVLSYNRATAAVQYLVNRYNIPRERFIVNYGGLEEALVEGLPDSHNLTKEKEMQQYLNRRVEFRISTSTDTEMDRPEGPEAGENTPGSARPGTKYSGNRNAGY